MSGAFLNPQKKPVKEVEIEVLVNGQAVKPMGKDAEITSGSKGAFSAVFELPPGTLPAAKVEVKGAQTFLGASQAHRAQGRGIRDGRTRATVFSRAPATSP